MTDDTLLAHVPAKPGGATIATIATEAGCSWAEAKAALSRLAQRNLVRPRADRCPKSRLYALTLAGEAAAKEGK